jgi:GNAT superfamily N-acetyltransferase
VAAIERIDPSRWEVLRTCRLRALTESPGAFGSSVEAEQGLSASEWIASIEDRAWFCALLDREPIGIAAGSALDHPSGRRAASVTSLFVEPGHRRTGVATRMFRAVRSWAESEGYTMFAVRVMTSNPVALAWCLAQGFQPTGERRPMRNDPSVELVDLELDIGGPIVSVPAPERS